MCDVIEMGLIRARRGLPRARVSTAAGLRVGTHVVTGAGEGGVVIDAGSLKGRPLVQFGPIRRFVRPQDVQVVR